MRLGEKISKFNENYYVQVDSMATQTFSLDEDAQCSYDSTEVYGDTVIFTVYPYDNRGHIVYRFEANNIDENEEYLKLVDWFAELNFDKEKFEKKLGSLHHRLIC